MVDLKAFVENPRTLNPKPLNPKPLNPKPISRGPQRSPKQDPQFASEAKDKENSRNHALRVQVPKYRAHPHNHDCDFLYRNHIYSIFGYLEPLRDGGV